MNKKYLSIILILIIFFLIGKIFIYNTYYITVMIDTLRIFILKVFPSLFIMIILNTFLIKLNFPYFFNKIFINNYLYIFIMSILSGSPNNAVILNDLLNKKQMNEKNASIAISFTTFHNPLFLYYYLNNIFHNKKILIIILFLIYFSNIIIFLLHYKQIKNNNYINLYFDYNLKKEFLNTLYESIIKILKIMAIIIFIMSVSSLIFYNYDNVITTLIKGIIEITQGLDSLTLINTTLKAKAIIAYTIITFASLSIQLQISVILEKHNINYKYFYINTLIKLLIGIIAILLLQI